MKGVIGFTVGALLVASAAALTLAAPSATAVAGSQDAKALAAVAGRWDGTVNTPEGEMPFTCDLRVEEGTLKGSLLAGPYAVTITSGTLEGDRLTLAGTVDVRPLSITGTYKDGKFEGNWSADDASGALKMAKVGTSPGKPPDAGAAPSLAASSGDPVTGNWEGVVNAPDLQRAFTLTLKLEGEKVTGEIASDEGAVALQSGTWSNGTLTIAFPYATGDLITMQGALQEGGKLAGTMDVGGQMQLGWAAQKRVR